jgi:chromosomal replication initiator protein
MYLATELTNNSLPQIAREFQKKDHTTVMYARDKVKNQMETDEPYRNRVRQLMALCQNS